MLVTVHVDEGLLNVSANLVQRFITTNDQRLKS